VKRMIAAVLVVAAAIAANATANGIPIGNKIADLHIQAVGLDTPVFQGGPDLLNGTPWPAELRHGPALYPDTAYPCTQGTVAIAGHHLTNTHPFRHLSELRKGKSIDLTTRYGNCSYTVVRVFSTTDDALWVLDWGGGNGYRLVLTTCKQIYNSAGEQIGLLRTIVLAVSSRK
jgi:LPXTG-site transpeptidase (sortase) family protein